MKASVKPLLEVRLRIEVLHDVLKELVESFSITKNKSVYDVLRKGIIERQYLQKVFIYFINDNGNKEGEGVLTIDWGKHFISAKTEETKTLRMDRSKSINQQLSEAIPLIEKHVDNVKSHFGIKKTEVWFLFRDEILNNPDKYKEACLFCGFSLDETPSPKWENRSVSKITMEYTPDVLSEFGICLTHYKRRD